VYLFPLEYIKYEYDSCMKSTFSLLV